MMYLRLLIIIVFTNIMSYRVIPAHESYKFTLMIPKGNQLTEIWSDDGRLSCQFKDPATGVIGLTQTKVQHCIGWSTLTSPIPLEITITNENNSTHQYTIWVHPDPSN